ncbi:MAG: hypothetical protein ACSHYA_19015 [Opitutaceae bacterium]
MKPTVLSFLIGTWLLLCFAPASLQAAESAGIEVILVEASSGGSGVDASLSPYAKTLKRLFQFDSYRKVSGSRLKLALPGEVSADLGGQGGRLKIDTDVFSEESIRANLNWTRGSKKLLHTRLQLRRGTPAVLGGPRSDGGSYLLLIIWK